MSILRIRTIILSLSLFMCTFYVTAQVATEDVLYLKDGSIIRGKVIELNMDSLVKIQTMGRNVLVFTWSAINRITTEPIVQDDTKRAKDAPAYKEKGYYLTTQGGILLGSSYYRGPPISLAFNMVSGYQFSSRLRGGIGLGFDWYVNEVLLLPIYADMRWEVFKDEPVVPYLSTVVGYSLGNLNEGSSTRKYIGGLLLGGGFGLKFIRSNTTFIMCAGYRYQESTVNDIDWLGEPTTEFNQYNRITLLFGLEF